MYYRSGETINQVMQLVPNKRRRYLIDWSLCIICQSDKNDRFTVPGAKGVATLLETAEARQDIVYTRIKSELVTNDIKWHRSCYAGYTSKTNIILNAHTFNNDGNILTPCTPASVMTRQFSDHSSDLSPNLCFICQKNRCPRGKSGRSYCQLTKLMSVTSTEGEESFKEAANLRQDDVTDRIIGRSLLNLKYHKACRTEYVSNRNVLSYHNKQKQVGSDSEHDTFKESFTEIIAQVDRKMIVEGGAIELTTIRETFNKLLTSKGSKCILHDNRKLKKMLEEHYGDTLFFQNQPKSNSSQLVYSRHHPPDNGALPGYGFTSTWRRVCNKGNPGASGQRVLYNKTDWFIIQKSCAPHFQSSKGWCREIAAAIRLSGYR